MGDTLSQRMGNALRLIQNGGIPKIVVPNNESDASDTPFDEEELQRDMKNVVIKRSTPVVVTAPPPPVFNEHHSDDDVIIKRQPATEHREEHALAREILEGFNAQQPIVASAATSFVFPPHTHPHNHVNVYVNPHSHPTPTATPYAFDLSDFRSVDLTNAPAVLKVLQGVRSENQPQYHTAALQAELRWKEANLMASAESQRAAQASNAINAALVTYQQLASWTRSDFKARKDAQLVLFQTTVADIRKALGEQKQLHRKDVQGLVAAWVAIVKRYTVILDSGLALLVEMQEAAGVDASVIDESSKVATALVAAIRNILKASAAKVSNVSDPEDVLALLHILGHAIADSTAAVETVLKDCMGVRPDFDEKRNQELQDALYKTQIEVGKCEAALAAVRSQASSASPPKTLDDTYALKQSAQAMEARLHAAQHLQEVLQKDLKDANVQRLISRLHDTCQRQATWRRASDDLAKLCTQKGAAFQEVYTSFTRREVIEEEVTRRETERIEQQFKGAIDDARRDLDGRVVAAIVQFGAGDTAQQQQQQQQQQQLGWGDSGVAPSAAAAAAAAKTRFLSRVLLDYAMLA